MKHLRKIFKRMLLALFLVAACSGIGLAQTGNALTFNGTNQTVSLPNGLTTAMNGGTEITIECWFKGTEAQSVVRLQDGTNWIVLTWKSGGNYYAIISTDGGTAGVLIGSAATLNDGKWHHIAMVWKKNTTNGFQSYLDGQLVAQRNSANVNLPTLTAGTLGYLGSMTNSSEWTNGSIDEVRIWNVALTQAQIQAKITTLLTPASETGLVAYYQFEEGTGTSVADMKGTNTGTTIGSPSWAMNVYPWMSGNYTVNPDGTGNQNFTTFGAALNAVNAAAFITGAVNFSVKDDKTFTETTQLNLTATASSATNAIRFHRSNDGANKPIINILGGTGTNRALLRATGCDYVTLDGLDFRETANGTNYSNYGFSFSANGNDGCSNNTIKNCDIQLNSANNNANGYGIEFYFNSATSNLNNNNLVQNNTISNVSQGIRFVGVGGGYDSGNQVTGNNITNLGNTGTNQAIIGINVEMQLSATISMNTVLFNPTNQTACNHVVGISSWAGNNTCTISNNYIANANIAQESAAEYFMGIYIQAGTNFTLSGNTIENFAQTSTTNGCTVWGIKVQAGNSVINNNILRNITNSSTSSAAKVVGIETDAGVTQIFNNQIYNLNSTGSGASAGIEGVRIHTGTTTATIYNNLLYDLKCDYGTMTPTVTGLVLAAANCNVYHNTVYINDEADILANSSACIYASTGGTIDLINNIWVNTSDMANGTRAVAFWKSSSTITNIAATTDNNLLYCGSSGYYKQLVYYDGTNSFTALGDYTTLFAPSREQAAKNVMPPFVSTTDGHINPKIASVIGTGGKALAAVTTDYEGDPRHATTPSIGADEILNPVIDITSNFSSFMTLSGIVSDVQTFTVSASQLISNLTVAAPTGLELSTNGTTYSNSIILTKAGDGTLVGQPLTIYVRVAATAPVGSLSGYIDFVSTPKYIGIGGNVGKLICVDAAGGNDANSGSPWAQAYKTLGFALKQASAGDEIWVKAGTSELKIFENIIGH